MVAAIDISPDLLSEARKAVPFDRVTLLIDNAYQLCFRNNVFDSVIGSSVLHHLEVNKALSEFYRVLKPGGTLYFTEPNMLNPQIALQKNIPYLKKKLGDSPDETAFFRWGLQRKLARFGFTHIAILPFDFLHPQLPSHMLPVLKAVCAVVEKIPLVGEFAGSLYIQAQK